MIWAAERKLPIAGKTSDEQAILPGGMGELLSLDIGDRLVDSGWANGTLKPTTYLPSAPLQQYNGHGLMT